MNKEHFIDEYLCAYESHNLLPSQVVDKSFLLSNPMIMYTVTHGMEGLTVDLPTFFKESIRYSFMSNFPRKVPKFKTDIVWFLPPVERREDGLVIKLEEPACYSIPIKYKEADRRCPYIDAMYISSSQTVVNNLLTAPEIQTLSEVPYQVVTIPYTNKNYDDLLLDYCDYVCANEPPEHIDSQTNPMLYNFYNMLFNEYGQHRTVLIYNGEIRAVLLWSENYLFFNVLYIQGFTENGSELETSDTCEKLLMFEVCKRLPKGTFLNLGGNGGSTARALFFEDIGYLYYYTIPSIKDFIFQYRKQCFKIPELGDPVVDRHRYLNYDPYVDILPSGARVPSRSKGWRALLRLYRLTTGKALPAVGLRTFKCFANYHNSMVVLNSKKGVSKSWKHFKKLKT